MLFRSQSLYRFDKSWLENIAKSFYESYQVAKPFKHVVIDNFLNVTHAKLLSKNFPNANHPVWLDWKKRSPSQYGKQGPGDSRKFDTLTNEFYFSLNDFNSSIFLEFLEMLTNIKGLIPDPYFVGGGMHQILKDGILDIHTDFNEYAKLGIYRRLNVLLYLTKNWKEGDGGELELWDKGYPDGKCIQSIPPIFNRMVIFETDKQSFHGHPNPWRSKKSTRRSIALYYYTSTCNPEMNYNQNTDWQGVAYKELPSE